MKNILKLSLIVLLTIFSINISFAGLVMPDSYSKKGERISFSFNGEWNEKLSYKSVNFKNLGNNGIGFFYNQSNGYNYCIVKTEKIENCEYLYDTEGYIYKKNDNLYFNENENIFGPYKEKEEIIKNLENISSIYKKNNDKKKKENIDKENTNVDFISDENNNNYFKFNGEIIGPYKDFEKINNNNFRYKILDSYYAYLDGKFIGPYISLHLKDYGINGIGISYLVNGTYNTGDRYIELKGKKYGPIKNDDFKDKYNFINLGINGIGNIYKKNDKSYYSVNGIEYGPYDIINKMYDLGKSGIGVIYGKKHNDKIIYGTSPVEYKSFLNINGKEYGPFMYQYYETKFQDLGENGFAFIYRGLDTTKGEYYANINGKVYGPYESIREIDNYGINGIGIIYKKEKNQWIDDYYIEFINTNLNNEIKINISSKLINNIDNIVSKLSIDKLNQVNQKLEKIDINNSKFIKQKDLIEYLKLKINQKLEK